MPTPVRLVLAPLVTGLLALLTLLPVAGTPASTASTTGTTATTGPRVVTRQVTFDLENVNFRSPILCSPDQGTYRVHATLVGPRRVVYGANAPRLNVLVHDLGSGGWAWRMPGHPAYDYAAKLAARGETSLVLDRLGYDASRLADGTATCLGAQADMLHQVVQHVRSARYDATDDRTSGPPAAHHVVVHGQGVGAALAQVEAATWDDVDGLVLMSWTDAGATDRAVDAAGRQLADCGQGDDYALFGGGRQDYRDLHFASAPASVQRTAARLRNADPCGDAATLAQLVTATTLTTGTIEAPVLLLFGSRDALNRADAVAGQRDAFTGAESVAGHTVRGAGNALPLERQAPEVRRLVARWLCHTQGC